MRELVLVLTGVFLVTAPVRAEQTAGANSSPRNLLIASSSTPVTGGKVTLNLSRLDFKEGSYVGEYHIKVAPYFFKNESGKLTIDAPEESLRKLTNGTAVAFTGKATSNSGKVKKINGKVTPTGQHEGSVSLWFMSGDTKLTFNTTYQSVENRN